MALVSAQMDFQDDDEPPPVDADDDEVFDLVAMERMVVDEDDYGLSKCTVNWADGTWSVVYLSDAMVSQHSCREILRSVLALARRV